MISNGSALVSEEKGPSLVSEYASLAPEEVGGKSKGQFKIKAERTTEEIKRDRRQIKQKIKGHGLLTYAYGSLPDDFGIPRPINFRSQCIYPSADSSQFV